MGAMVVVLAVVLLFWMPIKLPQRACRGTPSMGSRFSAPTISPPLVCLERWTPEYHKKLVDLCTLAGSPALAIKYLPMDPKTIDWDAAKAEAEAANLEWQEGAKVIMEAVRENEAREAWDSGMADVHMEIRGKGVDNEETELVSK